MRHASLERFRALLSGALVWSLCASWALAADNGSANPAPGASLGAIGDFSLEDLAGRTLTQQHFRGSRAVVLLFLGTECPVSNGYAPMMTELASRYAKQGVLVEGVHSDPTVIREQARQHAKEYSLTFPILLDPQQVLARQAGVTVTPEAVVLASDGKIMYRGRIDNRYSIEGKRRLEATSHDLDQALTAVLAGRQPAPATTPSFGCPLPKPRPASPQ